MVTKFQVEEEQEKIERIKNREEVSHIKYLVKEEALHQNHLEEPQEIVLEEVLDRYDNMPLK